MTTIANLCAKVRDAICGLALRAFYALAGDMGEGWRD